MARPNRVKEKLHDGGKVMGPFVKICDPAAVEIAGLAGFDFVIIDAEHGPISIESAQNLVRAAECVGITPIIRIVENRPSRVLRALDIGAGGVEVPHISSREAAQRLVGASKFAPEGDRGVCRFVRAARYSSRERQEYFRGANEETILIAHLEGVEAIENLDEILAVEGLDILFIGPYDLSQSMGVSGQVDHPRVVEKMEEVVKRSRDARRFVGTFVDDVRTAERWMDAGVQYISFSVDTGILHNAYAGIVQALASRL